MSAASPSLAPFRAARPSVSLAGADAPDVAVGLLTLLVAEDIAGLYRCEAVFGNWGPIQGSTGFIYFGRDQLDFGKAFAIQSNGQTIFDGRITALEGQFPDNQPPRICVLAEDRLQDLRMTRRTRTFTDITDQDLFTRVANEYGLTPNVMVDGPSHKVIAQVNLSDLAFLRIRARAIDAEVWVQGNAMSVQSRSARASAPLELTYRSGLREFNVIADLAGQRTGLSVCGWDVSTKSAVKFDADDSAVSSELNGGESGASILRTALGTRTESIVHTVPFNVSDARAEAQARFKQTARKFVVGRGVADPAIYLRAGTTVNLTGLGPLFSGNYYVTEVRTLFDGRELLIEFTAERAGLGKPG
ncbi:MAG TPA: hypothetical protein VG326_21335 [Tepidisphaeraceae bacterium]|jgi:hypothetical protein|nr:hypothetical protein [Tepidisphaeraceae bacterium]